MPPLNPFAEWQRTKVERREALLVQFLSYLKSSRVRCQNVTGLAGLAAVHISQQEGVPCNQATLLRNKRYKAKLLSYMVQSSAAGTDALDRMALKDPLAQVLVMTAELSVENLRRENVRLKRYVSDLEMRQVTVVNGDESFTGPSCVESDVEAQIRYVRTCQALLRVLRHYDGLLRLDEDSKCVLDETTRPQKVVVDSAQAGPFFEWLHLTRDVGGV